MLRSQADRLEFWQKLAEHYDCGYIYCRTPYTGDVKWVQNQAGTVGHFRAVHHAWKVLVRVSGPEPWNPIGKYEEQTYQIVLHGGGLPWEWREILLCWECWSKEVR